MKRKLELKGWDKARVIVKTVPDEPKKSNTKDTKKWCKGKISKAHNYEWSKNQRGWWVLTCTNCLKQDTWCWPRGDKDCKCGHHVLTTDPKYGPHWVEKGDE